MVQLYKRKGADILVNTETANQQSGGNIAILSGGGFVITWSDNSLIGGDTSGFGVKAQLFDANGAKVGSEFLVNTTTTGTQSGGGVAALASGRFIVTWTDASASGGDTSSNAVRGQLFEANGTRVGSEFLINTATTGSQSSPAVTELSSGGFVVSWTDASGVGGDNSGSGIKAQLFDANGAKVGGEILLNTDILGSQNSVALIPLGTGFAAAWTGAITSSGGITTGSIRVQLFDAAGAKIGTEQVVNASNEGNFNTPNISALASGFIVTWAQQDSVQAPGVPVTFDVHAQMFDANGVKVGSDFVVNTTTAGTQSAAEVDVLPGGGFIVTWSGPGAGTSGIDVFGQFFDASGAKVGPEIVVAGGDGTQNGARVDVLPNGDIVIIYNDTSGVGGDGSVSGVKMQILTLSNDAPTDIALSNTTLNEVAVENLAIATLGATNAGGINSHFTYQIVSDSTGGAFRIDGDQLVVDDNAKLDFETAPNVQLRIRVTDLNGTSYEESISLQVGDSATESRYAAGDIFVTNAGSPEFSGPVGQAALTSGGFAVVTHFTDIDNVQGTTSGYLAQIYDANGNEIGPDKTISLAGSAGADMVVTGLSSGGFILVYQGASVNGPSGNYFPIVAQILDASGNAVGGPFTVSTTNASIMGEPSVTTLGSGGFVVTWSLPVHEDGSDGGPFPSQIRGRIFDANGQALGNDFRVNTGIEGSQTHSHVVALSDGGFLVTWADELNQQGALEAQRFDAAGNKVGSELTIVSGVSSLVSNLAALSNGSFVVSWTELVTDGDLNTFALKARIVDANGANGNVLTLASLVSPYTEVDVHLTTTADGGFLLTWSGLQPSSVSDTDLFSLAQFFDASGVPTGDTFVVGQSAGYGEDAALAVRLASGDLALSWSHSFYADQVGHTQADGRIFDYLSTGQQPTGPTEGPDTLTGTPNDDTINGLGGNDVINGGGGNDVLIGGTGADQMTGGTGNDYYFVDNAGDTVIEAAGEGTDRVFASVSYTLGAGQSVELLTTDYSPGTAAINLTGNELANTIIGNDGTNILNGGAGADTLIGFGGDDFFMIDNAADVVVEGAGQGNDRVFASVSYALSAGQSVELLSTDFAPGTAAINLTGNELANAIVGNDGANILDGGAGADVLIGRAGDDFYYVDNAGDVVVENAGEGTDRVFASASYALGAGVSVELLTTDFNPGTAAINLTGNELANVIIGNDGANILDGKAGADVLVGRAGDDFYYVDNAGDVVVENAGEGNDRVFASGSYALAAGVSVELFTTDFNAGTAAINLTGNELANTIFGNDGSNILNGGAGADTLAGFGGDDFYYVDNAADTVLESAGQGNDRIFASTSYTLAAGASVEVLSTDFNPGTNAINLTGNELANVLIGNDGANTLDGKAGADTLAGFGGDDIYKVDNAGDVILEGAGQGSDQLIATVSYTLNAGASVEILFADLNAGAINLTGNELANQVTGNDSNNILCGGLGQDLLVGNGGADSFLFNAPLGTANADILFDFTPGVDKILLDHNIFTGLPLGVLSASAFSNGTEDANTRIIYNTVSELFLFDADGSGPGAAVVFATTPGLVPGISASDFIVV